MFVFTRIALCKSMLVALTCTFFISYGLQAQSCKDCIGTAWTLKAIDKESKPTYSSFSISPNQKHLLTVDTFGLIKVWEVATGEMLMQITTHIKKSSRDWRAFDFKWVADDFLFVENVMRHEFHYHDILNLQSYSFKQLFPISWLDKPYYASKQGVYYVEVVLKGKDVKHEKVIGIKVFLFDPRTNKHTLLNELKVKKDIMRRLTLFDTGFLWSIGSEDIGLYRYGAAEPYLTVPNGGEGFDSGLASVWVGEHGEFVRGTNREFYEVIKGKPVLVTDSAKIAAFDNFHYPKNDFHLEYAQSNAPANMQPFTYCLKLVDNRTGKEVLLLDALADDMSFLLDCCTHYDVEELEKLKQAMQAYQK